MTKIARRVLIGAAIMAMAAGSVAAQQYNRWVQVRNNTSQTIMYLYSTNTGTATWGEDILGADVIPAGTAINVNFDDGSGYCRMDIKAVFANGAESELRAVNVCEVATVTFQ